MIYGVDVASWQAENFALLVDGKSVDFAIIKATEGAIYINPKLPAQRDYARSNGLVVGYYHFARPGNLWQQADRFLATAQPAPGETLWLDWEDDAVTCAQKDQFIRYLKQKAPQARVGLYCNLDYWINHDTTGYSGDALWIAHHDVAPGSPGIETEWVIHQYSDVGIDHNIANFFTRQAMDNWAKGLIVESTPLDVIAQVLNLLGHLIELLAVQLRTCEQVEQARHDVLKEGVDQLRAAVATLISDDAVVARKVVDELARRLES